MNPAQYPKVYKYYPAAHSVFVNDLETAKQLLAKNVKFSAPCAFGVDCKLHFRPTLREHTDGRWLHEGESETAAPVPMPVSNLPRLGYRGKASHSKSIGEPKKGAAVSPEQASATESDDTDSDPISNAHAKPKPNPEELLKQSEAAIRKKIADLEGKYGKDLST